MKGISRRGRKGRRRRRIKVGGDDKDGKVGGSKSKES